MLAPRSRLSAGSAGKYISVDKGASALIPPRMSTWSGRIAVDLSLLAAALCSGSAAERLSAASWLRCFDETYLLGILPPIVHFWLTTLMVAGSKEGLHPS